MSASQQPATPAQAPKPPGPPNLKRAVKFYWYQWLGIPVMFLVVALALLGVFGERVAESRMEGEGLALRIEYPSRIRYKEINPLQVWITNRSARRLDTVSVSFSQNYLLSFSNVTFIPSAARPFVVEVSGLDSGETRLVLAGIQAERYGRHSGDIIASSNAGDTVRAVVSTLTLP